MLGMVIEKTSYATKFSVSWKSLRLFSVKKLCTAVFGKKSHIFQFFAEVNFCCDNVGIFQVVFDMFLRYFRLRLFQFFFGNQQDFFSSAKLCFICVTCSGKCYITFFCGLSFPVQSEPAFVPRFCSCALPFSQKFAKLCYASVLKL